MNKVAKNPGIDVDYIPAYIDNDKKYLRSLFTSVPRKRCEKFRGWNSSFLELAISAMATASSERRKFISESLPSPSLRNCGRILHKRHVGALGSARTHVTSMTKSREANATISFASRRVTWVACEKGKVIFPKDWQDSWGAGRVYLYFRSDRIPPAISIVDFSSYRGRWG